MYLSDVDIIQLEIFDLHRCKPVLWHSGSFVWKQENKKGIYDLLKKDKKLKSSTRMLWLMWEKKSRRTNSQIELNLPTAVKDGKKNKYISNKRTAKENLHLLLEAGRNMVTRLRKRLRYSVLSLPHSFGCSHCTEPLSWKTGTGIRMEPHNPGGNRQWLLHHWDTQVCGAGWIHPRAECHHMLDSQGISPAKGGLGQAAPARPTRAPAVTVDGGKAVHVFPWTLESFWHCLPHIFLGT